MERDIKGRFVKGYKQPKEIIKKRFISRKGYRHSIDTKNKIGLAHKGIKHTEESKKKISLNNARYWKGKKRPKSTGRKISKVLTGRKLNHMPPKAFKKGHIPASYIDGRSKFLSPARYGDDWDAIRLLIYKRDNYKCQDCGITMNEYGRGLDIHHKIPFLESRDNSFENLITLCRKCHMTEEHKLRVRCSILLKD